MKIWLSLIAAVLGVVVIAGLSLWGERERGGLAAFESKGFLALAPMDLATEAALETPERRRVFSRVRGQWQGGPPATIALLESALALTRDAAPDRRLTVEETAPLGLPAYGLNPSSFTVTITGEGFPPFKIEFGNANPLGLSRYAQIERLTGIWLVPAHLTKTWEDTLKAP